MYLFSEIVEIILLMKSFANFKVMDPMLAVPFTMKVLVNKNVGYQTGKSNSPGGNSNLRGHSPLMLPTK